MREEGVQEDGMQDRWAAVTVTEPVHGHAGGWHSAAVSEWPRMREEGVQAYGRAVRGGSSASARQRARHGGRAERQDEGEGQRGEEGQDNLMGQTQHRDMFLSLWS